MSCMFSPAIHTPRCMALAYPVSQGSASRYHVGHTPWFECVAVLRGVCEIHKLYGTGNMLAPEKMATTNFLKIGYFMECALQAKRVCTIRQRPELIFMPGFARAGPRQRRKHPPLSPLSIALTTERWCRLERVVSPLDPRIEV